MALTQERLNAAGCDTPNCEHDHSVLYLNSLCHPKSAVEIAYIKAEGVARVTCAQCKKLVADLAIA